MVRGVVRLLGGYASQRRDLRLLYVAMFLSLLGTSIVFPLRLLYAQAHHATPAEIGLMAAAFLLAPLVAQLPLGWLVDRWGRIPVLLSGMIAHAAISLFFILLSAPVVLIVLRFVEGVSVAAIRPAVSAYIADVTPEEHRSEAYGVLSATYNGGMFIGPLIGGIIGQNFGFNAAFAVCVVIELLSVAIVWGRIREPDAHRRQDSQSGDTSWRRLVSIPLAGAYAAFFCSQIVMGVLSSLWTIWIKDLGGSLTYIGATFTVFALPQIVLGALAGRLGDRSNRALVLLISGLLVAAMYVAYGFVTDLAMIMALGIAEGVFVVCQQPVMQGLLADASPPGLRGRVQGMAGAVGAVGGALAAYASLPLYHDARPLPFVLAAVVTAVGASVAAGGAAIYARRHPTAATASPLSGAAAR